jgi:hypothetical protein
MMPAKRLLDEVSRALREVIAPAIQEPYPKSQAYMAAVILEFISQGVEERGDIAAAKTGALAELFSDLSDVLKELNLSADGDDPEARLCRLIEALWEKRATLGERRFAEANQRIRHTLRELLDQDLKIATKAGS